MVQLVCLPEFLFTSVKCVVFDPCNQSIRKTIDNNSNAEIVKNLCISIDCRHILWPQQYWKNKVDIVLFVCRQLATTWWAKGLVSMFICCVKAFHIFYSITLIVISAGCSPFIFFCMQECNLKENLFGRA